MSELTDTLNEAGQIAQASVLGTGKAVLYVAVPVFVVGLAVYSMTMLVALPKRLLGGE